MTNDRKAAVIRRLGLLIILFSAIASHVASARAQAKMAHDSSDPRRDSWRLDAQPPAAEPSDPGQRAIAENRSERSDRLAPPWPLDQPPPQGAAGGGGLGTSGRRDEIPFTDGGEILVATFGSYQVFLTPSHRSIYTIAKLNLEQVLDGGAQNLSVGQSVDLIMAGGRVLLPDGRTITSGIWYENAIYCIQPGHRYLFMLSFQKEDDAFVSLKTWELEDGLAIANSPDDAVRVRQGTSRLAGLREVDFLETFREAIAQRRAQIAAQLAERPMSQK